MPARCTICADERRDILDAALVEGTPIRAIARHRSVSRSALTRHVGAGHVPLAMVADNDVREVARGLSLTARAEDLWTRARVILDDAEGRPTVQLQAVRELRAVVELFAKLTGAFAFEQDGPMTIVLTLDDGRPVPVPGRGAGLRNLPPAEPVQR
jgi:AcrR family transcriptional regulator